METCWAQERGLILTGSPGTEIVHDVLYVPETPGAPLPDKWGIFGRDRRLVTSTGYFRGPGPHLPHQSYTTDVDFRVVKQQAPDARYIYGGRINAHFGHFLLGCFPRFWRQSELAAQRLKILFHSPWDVDTLFAQPYIAEFFEAINLSSDDFIRFTEPVRLRTLIVPLPSFEEGHLVYPAFAELCHVVGERLTGGEKMDTCPRPVYFTKQRMRFGISRLANEDEFTDVLARNGVDVVSPEVLSVRDQLHLICSRRFVTGSFGSVFHSSIFFPQRTLLMLNWGPAVFTNFTLIDSINENDSHYIFPEGNITFCGADTGFGANWKLSEPSRTAEEFLFKLHALQHGEGSKHRRSKTGADLALGKRATQSSASDFSVGTIEEDASRAVSYGFNPLFSFHTSLEDSPWWLVDLEQPCEISEVWIYNRPDEKSRFRDFRIECSLDSVSWTVAYAKQDGCSFTADPFVWTSDLRLIARFIRIVLYGKNYLHLSRVRIFGDKQKVHSNAIAPGEIY